MARKPSGKSTKRKKKKAAKKAEKRSAGRPGADETLLTLTEVSKRTGISMPTLQKYKRNYQARIPAVGKGRKQRYPEAALAVFEEIKKENLGKRGRPAAGGARRRKAAGRAGGGLLSLAEIARRTGISYPTLLRYQKLYGDRIPSEGRGRKRRYPEAAVGVFQEIRSGSRRGRRPQKGGAAARSAAGTDRALARRIERIEAMQTELSRQLDAVVQLLKKPLQVTIRPE